MAKRKTIAMLIAVTVPDYMTVAQTKREVRSRINDLCAFHDRIGIRVTDRLGGSTYDYAYPEEKDVRLRKIGWARSLGLGVKKLAFSRVGERDAQVRRG